MEKDRRKRPQKCKECKKPAIMSLVWAEGMAYVPVCADHEASMRAHLKAEDGEGAFQTIEIKQASSSSYSAVIPEDQRAYIAEGAMQRAGQTGHQWHIPMGRMEDGSALGAYGPEAQRASQFASKVCGFPVRVVASGWWPEGNDVHAHADPATNTIQVKDTTDDLTILHECAHLMTKGSAHDATWQAAAAKLYAQYIGAEAAQIFTNLVVPSGQARTADMCEGDEDDAVALIGQQAYDEWQFSPDADTDEGQQRLERMMSEAAASPSSSDEPMTLKRWTMDTDAFDSTQLAANMSFIDKHDMQPGRGHALALAAKVTDLTPAAKMTLEPATLATSNFGVTPGLAYASVRPLPPDSDSGVHEAPAAKELAGFLAALTDTEAARDSYPSPAPMSNRFHGREDESEGWIGVAHARHRVKCSVPSCVGGWLTITSDMGATTQHVLCTAPAHRSAQAAPSTNRPSLQGGLPYVRKGEATDSTVDGPQSSYQYSGQEGTQGSPEQAGPLQVHDLRHVNGQDYDGGHGTGDHPWFLDPKRQHLYVGPLNAFHDDFAPIVEEAHGMDPWERGWATGRSTYVSYRHRDVAKALEQAGITHEDKDPWDFPWNELDELGATSSDRGPEGSRKATVTASLPVHEIGEVGNENWEERGRPVVYHHPHRIFVGLPHGAHAPLYDAMHAADPDWDPDHVHEGVIHPEGLQLFEDNRPDQALTAQVAAALGVKPFTPKEPWEFPTANVANRWAGRPSPVIDLNGQQYWGEPNELHAQVAAKHGLTREQASDGRFGLGNPAQPQKVWWVTDNSDQTKDRMTDENDLWDEFLGPEWNFPTASSNRGPTGSRQAMGPGLGSRGNLSEHWRPGNFGKFMVTPEGEVHTWNLTGNDGYEPDGYPSHAEWMKTHLPGRSPSYYDDAENDTGQWTPGWISTKGELWGVGSQKAKHMDLVTRHVPGTTNGGYDWTLRPYGDIFEFPTAKVAVESPTLTSGHGNPENFDQAEAGLYPVIYHPGKNHIYVGREGLHHKDVLPETGLNETREPYHAGVVCVTSPNRGWTPNEIWWDKMTPPHIDQALAAHFKLPLKAMNSEVGYMDDDDFNFPTAKTAALPEPRIIYHDDAIEALGDGNQEHETGDTPFIWHPDHGEIHMGLFDGYHEDIEHQLTPEQRNRQAIHGRLMDDGNFELYNGADYGNRLQRAFKAQQTDQTAWDFPTAKVAGSLQVVDHGHQNPKFQGFEGRRPILYDPAQHKLHVGPDNMVHFELAQHALGEPEAIGAPHEWHEGWVGPNPERALGEGTWENEGQPNEIGWYRNPPAAVHEQVKQALQAQDETPDPDWDFPTASAKTSESTPLLPEASHGSVVNQDPEQDRAEQKRSDDDVVLGVSAHNGSVAENNTKDQVTAQTSEDNGPSADILRVIEAQQAQIATLMAAHGKGESGLTVVRDPEGRISALQASNSERRLIVERDSDGRIKEIKEA
jgi:hypothetical protein